MFPRAFSAFVLALPVLTSASAVARTNDPSNQCNNGSVQCCQSTQSVRDISPALQPVNSDDDFIQANSEAVTTAASVLEIVIQDLTKLVGRTSLSTLRSTTRLTKLVL